MFQTIPRQMISLFFVSRKTHDKQIHWLFDVESTQTIICSLMLVYARLNTESQVVFCPRRNQTSFGTSCVPGRLVSISFIFTSHVPRIGDKWEIDAESPFFAKTNEWNVNLKIGNVSAYLSILATARNEAFYRAKWIEYHHLVGVEKFWITKNNSIENTTDVVQSYCTLWWVTLSHVSGRNIEADSDNRWLPIIRNLTFFS
jgi:hypothetical protein